MLGGRFELKLGDERGATQDKSIFFLIFVKQLWVLSKNS